MDRPLTTSSGDTRHSGQNRMLWPLASILSGAIFLSVLALVAYATSYAERIYPGVQFEGLVLGKLTPAQAEALLNERITYYRDARIPLRYRDRTWQAGPRELGADLDLHSVVTAAYAVGRGGRPWEDLASQAMALLHGWNITQSATFEPEIATAYLKRIAREIDRPARDAELRIEGTGLVHRTGQMGLQLDLRAAREAIHDRVIRRSSEPVELVVQETPPVLDDVTEARTQVERMLASGLVLQFEDRSWTLAPSEIAQMIVLTRQPAGDGVALGETQGKMKLVASLDEAKLRPVIEGIARQIARQPQDARITWDRQAGRLAVTQPSVDGRSVNVSETIQRLINQVTSSHRLVTLAVNIQKPTISSDNLDLLGIKELVAEGTTYFAGSPTERIQNIRVAASKFQDVLVPPGSVFVFGNFLGEVSSEEGYAEAYIIRGGRTELDYGGGVCQVSTTIFRAAFFGGFPIVERWPHAYRVQWYERGFGPGLDATVFTPQVDFRFRNDTEHWLLIQSYVNTKAGSLTFRIYGTRPNRQVTWEGPFISNITPPKPPVYQNDPRLPKGEIKQVDWAHQGADVTVRRIVKEGDKVVSTDTFFSRYQPWADVFLVGTKVETAKAGEG